MRIRSRGGIDIYTLRVEYSKPRGGKINDADLEQARSVTGKVAISLTQTVWCRDNLYTVVQLMCALTIWRPSPIQNHHPSPGLGQSQ